MDKKLLIYTILGNVSFGIIAMYVFYELQIRESLPPYSIIIFSLTTWMTYDYIALLHQRADGNHRMLWIGKATLITTFLFGGLLIVLDYI
ncbi:hypothetical protein SAMN05421743_101309 [Thalassobacillus cyri]|uniref:Uncharacterized protein n=1 Tax=Thalassobacillus cyri TaxID=571932 RepID=A0A1H3W5R8_9BACI|nr:hypothetical protein [Thalassobacillus cyri]SDZ81774.1 hypothetical protein SAMN05421743_101309 [Thalassobacillus cyri]